MRLSKNKINQKTHQKISGTLYQVIADITKKEEAKIFCRDILTEAEILALAKRLAIFKALKDGWSYRQIRSQFQVSPATIAKLQEDLDKAGVKLALEKIKIDQWASRWEKKIKNLLKKTS